YPPHATALRCTPHPDSFASLVGSQLESGGDMSTRATHITLHFVFVFLLALLCFTLSGNSAAASPAAQEESGGYAIVITQTVGLDPAVCADSSSITAAYNQAVYPCVTVHNTGSLTLT